MSDDVQVNAATKIVLGIYKIKNLNCCKGFMSTINAIKARYSCTRCCDCEWSDSRACSSNFYHSFLSSHLNILLPLYHCVAVAVCVMSSAGGWRNSLN